MGEWISVKNRVPDNYVIVLVYCGDYLIRSAYYSKGFFNEWTFIGDICSFKRELHITHWMVMPPAPGSEK